MGVARVFAACRMARSPRPRSNTRSKMASLGIEALATFIETGEKPSGYTDTGVTLITDDAADGVESQDSAYGLENCWGELGV